MIELGKTQVLEVIDIAKHGAYLSDEKGEDKVLLPTKKCPQNTKIGDNIEVFVYNDSSDRIISTTDKPLAEVGELKRLQVVSKTNIGYFVNIGLEKDVLLPFSETLDRVKEDQYYLLKIYVDKSKRLAATMKVKDYLKRRGPYKENDLVKGTIYAISRNFGIFVAVDNTYDGMIPIQDVKGIYQVGDEIEARVLRILKDGKLTLTMRDKAHIQMNKDAEEILDLLEYENGILNLGDKSDPEEILRITGLTKSAYKRAIGKLYKEGYINLEDKRIIKK